MILSLDLGSHRIMAAVVDKDEAVKQFTIEAPGVEKGRIGNLQETAKLVQEALQQNKVKVNQCAFVLPSTVAVTKEMQVPRVSRGDLLKLVRTNFSGITEVGDDHAVDYLPLGTEGEMDAVLGLLVRKSLIIQCVALAKLLGMRCRKVDLHMNALRKYLSRRELLGGGAFIAVCLEGASAEINLFENGRLFIRMAELEGKTEQDALLKNWAMSFNSNLMAAQEQDQRARSLAEQVRGIIQFQLSRNGQMPVSRVYFYGDAEKSLIEGMAAGILPEVAPLDESEEWLPYLNAVGATLSPSQELDLMDSLRQASQKQTQSWKNMLVFIAALAAVALLCVALGTMLIAQNSVVEGKMTQLELYLNSPETIAAQQSAKQAQSLLISQQRYNKTLERFNIKFAQQFRLGAYHVGGIFEEAQLYAVSVAYFDYDQGVISMTCYAKDSTVAAEFARALDDQDWADEVEFKSYAKESDEAERGYKFQLSGIMKGAV